MPTFLAGWLSKKIVPWILVGLLFTVGGISARMAVGKVSDLIDARVASAKSECNALWKAELAEKSLEVARLKLALSEQVKQADRQIRAAEDAARDQLEQMEKDNAALPGGDDCGLRADRVRLLPR